MKQWQGSSFITRKISKVKMLGLVIALLTPLSVFGLTLGPLQIKSCLNQPLEASIPLRYLMELDEGQIKVSVAQNTLFDKRSIYRAPWLSELQLSVVKHLNQSEIQLRTSRVIQDPVVELLLSITWPNGNIVRQYTLFLDPVDLKESSFENAKSDVQSFYPHTSEKEEAGNESYGPVKPDDTLWKIAHQMISGTPYTLSQGLLALYQKNPDVFNDQNVNELQVGSYLKLPTPEEMSATSAKQATQILARYTHKTEHLIQRQQTSSENESLNNLISNKPLKILSVLQSENEHNDNA